MNEFFRFPRMPHIAWLGDGSPRDDKVLSPAEAQALLESEVVVEEKLDGANLGISVRPNGALRIQNRGIPLRTPTRVSSSAWPSGSINTHEEVLFDALQEHLILFGEWCAARHSVAYDSLPDWFLVFDVYDRSAGRFWNTDRPRSPSAALHGACPVSGADIARQSYVLCAVRREPLPAGAGRGYRGTRGVSRVAHRAR